MCMGRVIICCPECKKEQAVTRPDSFHNIWSFEKPRQDEVEGKVLDQVLECKNPNCKNNFTIYWYETIILPSNM